MAWVYLDDHFDEHPKVLLAREAHRDAPWLFVAGLCYCRRGDTDGLIIAPQIPRLITSYTAAVKRALLAAGLWDDAGDGSVRVHDWSEWNRTKDERSASARNAARAKWGNQRAGTSAAETRSKRLAEARQLGTHTAAEWEELVVACGSNCLRCGEPFGPDRKRVKDHIVPIYQGGSDAIGNIQPLCSRCNSSKGSERMDYRPEGTWKA
ncbi:HNH endonuclease signature motif containing protein [Haloactinopolyspora sp.]|uniref:HNH endonuclease signature motif containing protein n=1 Tax=Haloactinopolyspora sp. TaxID=1966353 RepID=UPI00263939ED|nr:HNH endonuclease signature motif containing protein [Haloactinopolyspora sp.]